MLPLRDTVPGRHPIPIVTTSLILVNAAVFLFQVTLPERHLEQLVYSFGIVPARFTHPAWAAHVGLPPWHFWAFLTSMFLHGGWFHIISNMWILWIFGDNVEERMGSIRFLIFYVVSGVVAGLIHTLTNASATIPVIGASGAIAGVLGAYLMLFPLARVLCLVPIFIFPLFIEVYAFLFILIWFWVQFYSGTLSLMSHNQVGGIAWWAHIGGFLFGLVTHRAFLKRRPPARSLLEDA